MRCFKVCRTQIIVNLFQYSIIGKKTLEATCFVFHYLKLFANWVALWLHTFSHWFLTDSISLLIWFIDWAQSKKASCTSILMYVLNRLFGTSVVNKEDWRIVKSPITHQYWRNILLHFITNDKKEIMFTFINWMYRIQ